MMTIATAPMHDCSIALPGIHFTRSLNHAHADVALAEGGVTVAGGAGSDHFNDPRGRLTRHSAPLLLAPLDNRHPFTFSARIVPQFHATYDAGALYLFASSDLWQKFAFERDEKAVSRIVSVRTVGSSDDNNHQAIPGPAAYLKMSSDTRVVGLYYSADGHHWDLARLVENNYPETLWIGIGAQSPVGQGSAATFDQLSLRLESVTDFRRGI